LHINITVTETRPQGLKRNKFAHPIDIHKVSNLANSHE